MVNAKQIEQSKMENARLTEQSQKNKEMERKIQEMEFK
jgi:hypothetical protein